MTQIAGRHCLVVLGKTGFIGGYFLPAAQAHGWGGGLTRSVKSESNCDGEEWAPTNIQDAAVWQQLLIPDRDVVSLAHANQAAGTKERTRPASWRMSVSKPGFSGWYIAAAFRCAPTRRCGRLMGGHCRPFFRKAKW
ncbi:hypothetical protein DLREEDagrD3_22410 [Denitratisoma sp. agr-D3]